MTGIHDDLATLFAVADEFNATRMREVLKRVEAEIARLERDNAVLRELPSRETVRRAEAAEAEVARLEAIRLPYTLREAWQRAETLEAEVARLKDGLRRIAEEGSAPWNKEPWSPREIARALLAEEES